MNHIKIPSTQDSNIPDYSQVNDRSFSPTNDYSFSDISISSYNFTDVIMQNTTFTNNNDTVIEINSGNSFRLFISITVSLLFVKVVFCMITSVKL